VERVGKEAEICAVLDEHIQAREKIANLGATVKASSNMCLNGGMRNDETVDSDWLAISANIGAPVKASANACLNSGMRTDETMDSDWLIITAKRFK
jgi:hypothetical protein